jgi:hypothetical protein
VLTQAPKKKKEAMRSLFAPAALAVLIATSFACGPANEHSISSTQGASTADSDASEKLHEDEARTAALDAQYFVSDVGYDEISVQPAVQPSELIAGSELDNDYQYMSRQGFLQGVYHVTAGSYQLLVLLANEDMDLQIRLYHPETQAELASKQVYDYYLTGRWTYDVQVVELGKTTVDATQFTADAVPGTPSAVQQSETSTPPRGPVTYGVTTVASETVYLMAQLVSGTYEVTVYRPDGSTVGTGNQASGASSVTW